MGSRLHEITGSLANWRGTALELAKECNSLMQMLPSLASHAGSANERLVRHYVQVGVLTPPEREGREALFGVRQVVEFLVARYLLNDGWPLAKVGEMARATDVAGLLELIPAERAPTPAQETVARYRRELSPPRRSAPQASIGASRMSAKATFPAANLARPFGASDSGRVLPTIAEPVSRTQGTPVERAAEISRRRVALEENLQALGNRAGRPETRRLLRISLTPWCHVHIDARHLRDMSDATPGILGAALTQALHDERTRKGEKT